MAERIDRSGQQEPPLLEPHEGSGQGGPAGGRVQGLALPVEARAFAGILPEPVLLAAVERARRLGVGADQVLIAQGHVSPDEAARILAGHLGVRVADPDRLDLPRTLDMARMALRVGAMPQPQEDGRTDFILAIEGREIRHLARALGQDAELAHRVQLIAPATLRRGLLAQAGPALAHAAVFGRLETSPQTSAGGLSQKRVVSGLALSILVPVLLAICLPPLFGQSVALGLLILQTLLSLVFLGWIALRLAGCFYAGGGAVRPTAWGAGPGNAARMEEGASLSDRDLPVYSVLVPLYREAAVVPHLVEALKRLDYPAEKLDIKLVVEADDSITRAAIAAVDLPSCIEEIAVPAIGPRTKPKALALALAFTRGSHVCIFDAEDHPEPDQLRRALMAFRTDARVGCVQARLCVDNGGESWISGQFAAEYAGQFDVLLPILSALDLPILLGGTSNHFRRDVLEKVGAWDPFNVTEDADLGIRLARAGWRTHIISASTFEEAPITWKAWLGQRTRWMKGWAQTLLVHARAPQALVREMGLRATLALLLLTAGPFAAALTHPLFMGLLLRDIARGEIGLPCETWPEVLVSAISYSTLVAGLLGAGLTIATGLRRRGQKLDWRIISTIPFYWLLSSVATCNALVDLVWRPFYWKKTEHGLSRARHRPSPAAVPQESAGSGASMWSGAAEA